jgi:PKD repeat protein
MYMSNKSKWKNLTLVLLAFLILGASIPPIQSLSANLRISSTGTISYLPGTIGPNLWTADFETGTLSQFTDVDVQGGNVLEASTLHAYNGVYGLHIRKVDGMSTAKGTYAVLPVMYDFHLSFAIRYNEFAPNGWIRLVELRTEGGGTKLLWMDAEPRIYWMGPNEVDRTSQLNINDGQWHTIDMYVSLHKDGMVFIYVDGQAETSLYGGVDFTGPNEVLYSMGEIWVGVIYSNNDGGLIDLSYDDIRLDEWTPPERPPRPPETEFVFYPTVPEPGETVSFYAEDYCSDVDGSITAYEWTFPDGTKTQGASASYIFQNDGEYDVILTVTDDTDIASTLIRTILVYSREPVSITGGWNLPLRTEGTKILDSVGNDVTLNLTGVDKMGSSYANPVTSPVREVNPAYYLSDAELMSQWGVKMNRVWINWYWYMTDYEYREIIKQLVDAYTSNGILVLMDVQSYNFRGYSTSGTFPQAIDLTKEQAWQIGNDAILMLKAVAHDFLYNPMVIAVEINEFRPQFPDDYMYNYLFKFELVAQLEAEVHSVNPELLIFMEFGQSGWNSQLHDFDSIRPQCQALIENRANIVYSPHCYYSSWFGRIYVWDMYESGDLSGGKTAMYTTLTDHYLYEQNYYDIPIVVTEWGCDGQYGYVILEDEFDYFIAHNWGSVYHSWFRAGDHYNNDPTITMYLLDEDWETPSSVGGVFQQKLAEIGLR